MLKSDSIRWYHFSPDLRHQTIFIPSDLISILWWLDNIPPFVLALKRAPGSDPISSIATWLVLSNVCKASGSHCSIAVKRELLTQWGVKCHEGDRGRAAWFISLLRLLVSLTHVVPSLGLRAFHACTHVWNKCSESSIWRGSWIHRGCIRHRIDSIKGGIIYSVPSVKDCHWLQMQLVRFSHLREFWPLVPCTRLSFSYFNSWLSNAFGESKMWDHW